MATLTIKINMDNAAFEDPNEIKRILTVQANYINENMRLMSGTPWSLLDINGNKVGTVKVTK